MYFVCMNSMDKNTCECNSKPVKLTSSFASSIRPFPAQPRGQRMSNTVWAGGPVEARDAAPMVLKSVHGLRLCWGVEEGVEGRCRGSHAFG